MNIKDKSIIYIITNKQQPLNYRVKKILELSPFVGRMVLVTKNGEILDDNHIVTGSYLNPTGVLRKIGLLYFKKIIDKYIFFPSPLILFIKKANRVLKKEIENNLIHDKNVTVITTLPPHDITLIGLYLKRKFPRIKWIVDWRDLWSYDEYHSNKTPNIYKKKLLRIEKEILNCCDLNITTNEFAKNVLCEKYKIPEKKVKYLYHPFDRTEFSLKNNKCNLINRIKQKQLIQMAFVGNLFKEPKVPGNLLLDSLTSFVQKFDWPIELNLIGNQIWPNKNKIHDKRFVIKEFSRLNHKEAFEFASRFDFLVLLLGDVANAKIIMHAKYSHYLALDKTILAFVPIDSFISKSVKLTNAGYVIDINSNISSKLYNLFISITKNGQLKPHYNEKEKFNWENIRIDGIDILTS